MTDIPMLFSGAMVRALLEGRKTQTRRLLKLPTKTQRGSPIYEHPKMGGWEPTISGGGGCFTIGPGGEKIREPEKVAIWHRTCGVCIVAPYQPGDLIWVREAWANDAEAQWEPEGRGAYYRADPGAEEARRDNLACGIPHEWRASIHMPRWASRLTLEVTDVRVQRLQEISEADAVAEGVIEWHRAMGGWPHAGDDEMKVDAINVFGSLRDTYSALWDSLNAPLAPWESNPWVVALTFTVHQQNIDALKAGREAA